MPPIPRVWYSIWSGGPGVPRPMIYAIFLVFSMINRHIQFFQRVPKGFPPSAPWWGHVGEGGCVVRMVPVLRLTVCHISCVSCWCLFFKCVVVWVIGAGVVAGGLSVCLSFGLFARLFVCLAGNLLVCLFSCPPACQSVVLCVCLFLCLLFVCR